MYRQIKDLCDKNGVTLVAVSKTRTNEEILELYNQGQRIFGENRAREMKTKWETLPQDINWHMIGHLQKKKVKYIAEYVDLIHSVDNIELLETINKRALQYNRVIKVLLQLKVAKEQTKSGFELNRLKELHLANAFDQLENIEICGLMAMGSFVDDESILIEEFETVNQEFKYYKEKHYGENSNFEIVSMGMSNDHQLAIKHGSTMVRIGTLLFK